MPYVTSRPTYGDARTPTTYESKTVAQAWALALGVTLLVLGIVGFVGQAAIAVFGSSGFTGPADVTIFWLDPWHSALHSIAGLLGLATWRRSGSARAYALGVGVLYLVVAAWGFTAKGLGADNLVFGLMHVRLADNVFHAALAVVSVAVGLATPRHGSRLPTGGAQTA